MPLLQFKTLCRELNLGARYQQHLNQYLLPTDLALRATLKTRIIASQKAALKAAAQLAVLKKGPGARGVRSAAASAAR